MRGSPVAFDPDTNDADREFVEHFRPPATPRSEHSARRLSVDPWRDLSTEEVGRRMVAGLCARLMPDSHPADDRSRAFASMPLTEMARMFLKRRGWTHITGRGDIAMASLQVNGTRAVSAYLVTDDFVSVLLNLARASLTQGYTVAPRTFTSWCRATTLQDFRQTWRIALGAGPLLQQVPEHAEYTRAPLPSRAEPIQLATWGKIIAFTRQAMVNDDLGTLARIPQLFGNSAATMEGDVVYGVLTGNPIMSDGNALFSASHKNVGTAAAITIASLSEARQLLRTQTSPEGAPLNLEPRFLICGPKKEVEALQLTASVVVPTTLGTAIPVALKSVEVVVDARITDLSWYIAASPLACDTLEYARLAGTDEGPTLEARDGFDVDGVEFKCREEFACAAIDWRGLVRNQGA